MDPDAFSASLYKWDPRGVAPPLQQPQPPPPPPSNYHHHCLYESVSMVVPTLPSLSYSIRPREVLGGGLEEFFQAYGIRYHTAAKIAELGFTVNTLLDMKDEELDDMMNGISHIFRWELLVGERYGIKAAVRAERRRLEEEEMRRRHLLNTTVDTNNNALDALSQEGLSEERVQQEKEVGGSGGGGGEGVVWENVPKEKAATTKKIKKKQQRRRRMVVSNKEGVDHEDDDDDDEEEDDNGGGGGGGHYIRLREHPFIVTEPGEVARGKKNGLDYLFHLFEQCRDFLIEVQNIAKERGQKCPTKVTNQVFRYAKKAGANYINKPKMRHYVHCYALHCLDEAASNALRRLHKEKAGTVGEWREACYKPLVEIASHQGWDIDSIFSAHPRLSIWYVPTKLRDRCHEARIISTTGITTSTASISTASTAAIDGAITARPVVLGGHSF